MARLYQKLAPCGGEGGREWDDDVYEGIKKVYVGQDLTRITYVKFDYVKEDGQVVTREYGTITQNPKEFALEYPDEHITAVEGSYNKVAMYATEVITSLVFKTSKGKTSPTFGPNLFGVVNGTKFVFEDEGKKIVGFHGRSDNAIDALGVYTVQESLTTSSPLYKLEAKGGTEGRVWDDGAYDGVKTLRIGQDDSRITYLEFDYEKSGKSETRPHGVKGEKLSELVLDFPDEYINSVEATYDKPSFFRNTVITSLKLETSKGKTSIFGYEKGKKFVLKQNGHRLVGFHGKEGEAIDALGAYFAPVPTPAPAAPVPASAPAAPVPASAPAAPVPAAPAPAAPNPATPAPAPAPAPASAPTPTPVIGDPWSDGNYDGVKKIQIGLYDEGVSFLKFEYIKGNGLVSGDGHGKITSHGVEEFVLEDGEYLRASMEGYYKPIPNTPFGKIVSLRFKTNKRESPLFGKESGEKFSLEQKDQKITGFHGRATDVIYDLMFACRHISIR